MDDLSKILLRREAFFLKTPQTSRSLRGFDSWSHHRSLALRLRAPAPRSALLPAGLLTEGGCQCRERGSPRASPAGRTDVSPVTQTSDGFVSKIPEQHQHRSEHVWTKGTGSRRSQVCAQTTAWVRAGGHI